MSRLPTIPSIRRLRLLVATASLPALLLALPLATSAQPADAGRNNDTGMQARCWSPARCRPAAMASTAA